MTYTGAPIDAEHASAMWTTATILGRWLGRAFLLNSTAASVAWPAGNDAYAMPFLVSTPITFTRMFFIAGTTPGTANFDLGIYDSSFQRLTSLGATAASNANSVLPPGGGVLTAAVTLTRGRYYMAMSAAATTITVTANQSTNGVPRAMGMLKMATAHPLPSTFTPASVGTLAMIPMIGMMTRADLIL